MQIINSIVTFLWSYHIYDKLMLYRLLGGFIKWSKPK